MRRKTPRERLLPTVLALAVLLPALTARSVFAGDFYVAAGLGDEVEDGEFGEPFKELGIEAEDRAWKALVGLDLGEHLAVEVAFQDFGERICCPGLADAGFVTSLEGVSAAVVGRLPLDRLELFAKAGLLLWEEDGTGITIIGPQKLSADGSDPLFGVGATFDLVERFALRAEWESFDLGEASSDTFWLGIEIRF